MIDLKQLIESQVHFGHKTSRWNPHMRPYIWGEKNDIHIINVARTQAGLEQAAHFLKSIAEAGKQVLFVGTKKAAQKAIEAAAQTTGMPHVNQRWVGGTVTNFSQVKKSFTKLLHMQDVIAKATQFVYTKKELSSIQKNVERLQKNIGGITSLKYANLGALVVVDIRKDVTAVREARAAGIPVVAFVDTNDDPLMVDHIIPTNNDSPKAIGLLLGYLAEIVKEGADIAKAKPVQQDTGADMDTVEPFFMEEDEDSESAAARSKKATLRGGAAAKAGAPKRARTPNKK